MLTARTPRRSNSRRHTRPRGAARWILSAPLLVFLGAFAIFPLFLGAWISVTDRSLRKPAGDFTGFANYAETLADERFWDAVWFTVRFTAITTLATLTMGFALALLVNRRFPGKKVMLTALILPIMIAPALMGIMFRLILNSEIGAVPAILGLFGVQISLFAPDAIVPLLLVLEVLQWTPFTFLILYAGLQSLPSELFEAAAIDGASSWQAIGRITIPLMIPSFFVAGFLRAVDALRTFDVIFVLTGGGPGTRTTTMSIYVYKKAFIEGEFGLASAAAMVIMLLVIPLVPLIVRRVTTQPGDSRRSPVRKGGRS